VIVKENQLADHLRRADPEPRSEYAEAPVRPGIWRVLVVEDVPSQQKLLVTVLKKAGHSVATADNGADAVELVRREPFDIVLMDIQMPGMNGLDATRAIRQHEAQTGSHVTIVAVTAHALNGDAQKCIAAGTDAYLRKPINLVELMGLLKQMREQS
jgi:CheY-like chemotaxis protein